MAMLKAKRFLAVFLSVSMACSAFVLLQPKTAVFAAEDIPIDEAHFPDEQFRKILKATYDDGDGVFTLASASDNGYALMITNFNDEPKRITVHADAKTANIYTLNGVSNLELTNTLSGNFDLTLEPNTLVYAEFLK